MNSVSPKFGTTRSWEGATHKLKPSPFRQLRFSRQLRVVFCHLTIWLNPTSTWLISYSFYFLCNPFFLVITHLVLFLVYLLTNPHPYFKFPYQSYPYVSLLFPFLDSHALSLCFLSTIASFSHHIVLSVVWRNVYKDSVQPLVKQENTYSSKFSSVQFSPVQSSQVQYQWYKPIQFYLSINKEKDESLFFSCWQSVLLGPLFNKDNTQLSSIHPVPSHPHIHPLSIPFSLSIHLINSRIVAQERARQKANQSYIRPAELEDTNLTPLIYDEHPNLFTRILLQVDISATLLGKVSAPEQVRYIPSAGGPLHAY